MQDAFYRLADTLARRLNRSAAARPFQTFRRRSYFSSILLVASMWRWTIVWSCRKRCNIDCNHEAEKPKLVHQVGTSA